MKKKLSSMISSLCNRYGVSRRELAVSALCVLVGTGYLIYSYIMISIIA